MAPVKPSNPTGIQKSGGQVQCGQCGCDIKSMKEIQHHMKKAPVKPSSRTEIRKSGGQVQCDQCGCDINCSDRLKNHDHKNVTNDRTES